MNQDWQPISNAPQNGNKIIVWYLNATNNPRVVIARWLSEEQAEESDADGVGLGAGWYECIDNWADYTEVEITEGIPMHWMPLPQPPGKFVFDLPA